MNHGLSEANWQQFAVSANATYFDFQYSYGTANGFGTGANMWAVGDTVEFFCEFEMDADCSALAQVSAKFQSTVSAVTAIRANGYAGGGGTFTNFPRLASGVIVSPQYVIQPATTLIWPYCSITGTGTFRIGRCGIRRVY